MCFGLIIIRHFFDGCKKLTIYTDIYEIQLHFQKFMRANTNRMAGRGFDIPALRDWHIMLYL